MPAPIPISGQETPIFRALPLLPPLKEGGDEETEAKLKQDASLPPLIPTTGLCGASNEADGTEGL